MVEPKLGSIMTVGTIIIDDDPVFSGYLTSLLEAAGLENVTSTGDARRTVRSAKLENYARIVCDLSMPDMDGIEFIQHLSEISWPGELIIASGETQSVIKAAARLAGISGLNIIGTLTKPANLQDVVAVLENSRKAQAAHAQPDVDKNRASLIKDALERLEVLPVYQPQLSLHQMRIDGFEALMRLRLQDGSLANPGEFFNTLTPELADKLAIKQNKVIISDFRSWTTTGRRIKCSINMSPRQISERTVTESLIETCKHFRVDPAHITIEITENEPLINSPDLISAMSRLRIAGFGLALDDFGSGHANIQELGWLPFSEIKTDLVFGQNLLNDPFSRAAIEFAVEAANQLELELTVEGLEGADAVSLASELGADRGQGYAIARPIPVQNAQRLAMAS